MEEQNPSNRCSGLKRPHKSESNQQSKKQYKTSSAKFNEFRFRHGNYNRYYGYRNANQEKDQRIAALQESWFRGKNCLDIGCNVGHLTLWIARYFKVSKIKGVDIDCELIKAAKNNIVNYIDNKESPQSTKQTVESTKSNCSNLENNSHAVSNVSNTKEVVTPQSEHLDVTKQVSNEDYEKNSMEKREIKNPRDVDESTNTNSSLENVAIDNHKSVHTEIVKNSDIGINNSESSKICKPEEEFPYNVSFITVSFKGKPFT